MRSMVAAANGGRPPFAPGWGREAQSATSALPKAPRGSSRRGTRAYECALSCARIRFHSGSFNSWPMGATPHLPCKWEGVAELAYKGILHTGDWVNFGLNSAALYRESGSIQSSRRDLYLERAPESLRDLRASTSFWICAFRARLKCRDPATLLPGQ